MRLFPSLLIIVALAFFSSLAYAQKVKTAEAEVSYTYSSDITLRAAKHQAYEQAKAEAIRSLFPGTIEATMSLPVMANHPIDFIPLELVNCEAFGWRIPKNQSMKDLSAMMKGSCVPFAVAWRAKCRKSSGTSLSSNGR